MRYSAVWKSVSVYCSNPFLNAKWDILVYNENCFFNFLWFSLVERTVQCQLSWCPRFSILFLCPSQKEDFCLCLLVLEARWRRSPLRRADARLELTVLSRRRNFGPREPGSKFHICMTLVRLHVTLCISTARFVEWCYSAILPIGVLLS